MTGCIFCKIRDGIIPKDFIYEDKDVMVFPDINPLRPIHLLVIPKKHVEDFAKFQDDKLLGKIRQALQKMIIKERLENKGYRIVVNGGGAQLVKHLHFHLLAPVGKTFKA